jgi:pimeloyl-ACP methyl ester carboxylesterase
MSAYLFFAQSSIVYQPGKTTYKTPADAGLEYEDIVIETADGIKISAWFVPVKEAKGVVLFCHGNAGNITHRTETVAVFHGLGLSTFIFDYRGYGKSEGKPTEEGTHLDAAAAWNYLLREKGVKPEEIIIAGRSLGGPVASRLAAKTPPRALIVESSFSSVPDLAAGLYPYLPVRLLCRFAYNTGEYVKQVKCPVLVIHSPDDGMIPFAHGKKIFEAANKPKRFMQIRGSHNEGFSISGELYTRGLKEFIFNE